jgi:ABC-type transporter Mla subunit MlaD
VETLAIARDITIIALGLSVIVALLVIIAKIGPLIKAATALTNKANETTVEVKARVDALMPQVHSILKIAEDTRTYIDPTLASVQAVAKSIEDSVAELKAVVEHGAAFSNDTIEQAKVVREGIFTPLSEAASLLTGVSAAVKALPKTGIFKRRKKKGGFLRRNK